MREQPVVLRDRLVTLRAWEPDDAPAVFAACQDPLISRFIPVPLPYTEEVARQFVVRRRADWDSDDERSFAITDEASGEVLGSIAPMDPGATGRSSATGWHRGRAVAGLPPALSGSSPTGRWRRPTSSGRISTPTPTTTPRDGWPSGPATLGKACDEPGTSTVSATPRTPSSTS